MILPSTRCSSVFTSSMGALEIVVKWVKCSSTGAEMITKHWPLPVCGSCSFLFLWGFVQGGVMGRWQKVSLHTGDVELPVALS